MYLVLTQVVFIAMIPGIVTNVLTGIPLKLAHIQYLYPAPMVLLQLQQAHKLVVNFVLFQNAKHA
jgi:hypothetical protein